MYDPDGRDDPELMARRRRFAAENGMTIEEVIAAEDAAIRELAAKLAKRARTSDGEATQS